MELERKEVVPLAIGTLLAVAGLMVDDIMMVAILLAGAAFLGCYIMISHRGLGAPIRVAGCIFILSLAAGAFGRMYHRYEEKALASPEGDLVAANDPPSKNPCYQLDQSAYRYRLFMGRMTIQTNKLPHVVVEANGKSILKMDIDDNGSVTISLDVFNEKGDVLISIERGHYKLSNTVFQKIQTDWSGFVIFDSHKEKVLDLRILNRYEVRLTGSLLYKAGVNIDDDHLEFPGHNQFFSGCISGGGAADFSINR